MMFCILWQTLRKEGPSLAETQSKARKKCAIYCEKNKMTDTPTGKKPCNRNINWFPVMARADMFAGQTPACSWQGVLGTPPSVTNQG